MSEEDVSESIELQDSEPDLSDVSQRSEETPDKRRVVRVVEERKAKNNDTLSLEYSSCQLISVLISVLSKMGLKAGILFSKDTICCSHNNSGDTVMFDLSIRTADIIDYAYNSKCESLLLGIKPSEVASKLGKKKADMIKFTYDSGNISIIDNDGKDIDIESVDYSVIALDLPEYPELPHVKIAVEDLKNKLNWITKTNDALLKPYSKGFRVFAINKNKKILGTNDSGRIPGTYLGEPIIGVRSDHLGVPLKYKDYEFRSTECIALKHLTIQIILEALKACNPKSVIKMYFTKHRKDHIRLNGKTSNADGEWNLYLAHSDGIILGD